MNRQRLIRKLRIINHKLNKKYIPVEDKPFVKIAELTAILPALGLFYLWHYFDLLGISYYRYFNLSDAIAVLYENLMLMILIGVLFSPGTVCLLLTDLKSRSKGLSIITLIVIIVLLICGFGVLINMYKFATPVNIVFITIITISSYVYFFESRNLGFWMHLAFAFIYMYATAAQEAKYILKEKPKFTIYLKQHSEQPILTEESSTRFYLYKTSNYYFIKDEKENKIFGYSISTQEETVVVPLTR